MKATPRKKTHLHHLSLRQTISLTLNCGVEEGTIENTKRNKLVGLELEKKKGGKKLDYEHCY